MKHLIAALIAVSAPVHVMALTFSKDFKWCVATAGHQVEGDNFNSDWWEWEQQKGRIANGDKSGKASFHIDRMEEDVSLMKSIGANAYRFSMEWSRFEPKEGEFDESAVALYRKELDLLKKAGIEPVVTIHHFVQPQWFTATGGFERKDAPELFLRYVKKLEQEFGKDVRYWVTFNEPTVVLNSGYGQGLWPPGETYWRHWDPMMGILKSHVLAYRYLHEKAKEAGREVYIGMAHHIRPAVPNGGWLIGKLLPEVDYLFNWAIPVALKTGEVRGFTTKGFWYFRIPWRKRIQMDELKNTQDYFGLNYYTREYIGLSLKPPFLTRTPMPGLTGTDLNWGIDPEGFFEVLKKVHETFPDQPIFITENGLADSKDQWREKFVVDHLTQLHRAMTELNHKVIGYCHWSLMDNFEWHEGFWPRFGLFEVDFKNGGERKARPSLERIQKIFKTGEL